MSQDELGQLRYGPKRVREHQTSTSKYMQMSEWIIFSKPSPYIGPSMAIGTTCSDSRVGISHCVPLLGLGLRGFVPTLHVLPQACPNFHEDSLGPCQLVLELLGSAPTHFKAVFRLGLFGCTTRLMDSKQVSIMLQLDYTRHSEFPHCEKRWCLSPNSQSLATTQHTWGYTCLSQLLIFKCKLFLNWTNQIHIHKI